MYVFGELKKADLENLSADVSPGVIGRIYYNTTSLKAMLDDGTVVRAFLKNDAYAVFGNNGTAANNIRLHRGASSVLQFVLGNDGTAEGTLSTALAKLSFKAEAYATGSLPSAANAGRIAWDTSLLALKVDNGSSWIALQPLATKGDLYSFSTVPVALGVGTNGQYLAAASGQTTGLQWTTFPVTTKGDIFVYSTTVDRLPVGTSLQLLGVSSGAATGLAWTSATTTPTASAYAGWDANVNFSANSFLPGYATTATAAGTTTLTVTDKWQQFFTGSTTQTVTLPVTSTLALGQQFLIVNRSSGTVTVKSSGANTIQAMGATTQLLVTVILTSGTTAASWDAVYASNTVSAGGTVTSVTFTGDNVLFSNTPSTAVTTSGTLTPTLKTQTANTFLAGPVTGVVATPTFRVFATEDYVAPTIQTYLSSVTATTYTLPTSPRKPLYLKVRVMGAGGGGAGSSTVSAANGTAGSAGGDSAFLTSGSTNIIVAAGGGGGKAGSTFSTIQPALGGAPSISAGATQILAVNGGDSFLPVYYGQTTGGGLGLGGAGGVSHLGGNGTFATSMNNGSGGVAKVNSGSGGGGGGGTSTTSVDGAVGGGGGGAGAYVEAFVFNPSSTYKVTVGNLGAGGAAGTSGNVGGNGSIGFVIVEEHYQ